MPLSKSYHSVYKAELIIVAFVPTVMTLLDQVLGVDVEGFSVNERPEDKGLRKRNIDPTLD